MSVSWFNNEADKLALARYLVAKILVWCEDESIIEWEDVPLLGENEWDDVHALVCLTLSDLASAMIDKAGPRGAELFRETS